LGECGKAKAKLNECAKNVLIAATPALVLKASPRAHGAAGFNEMTKVRAT
jgi:hypothetical protein